MYLLTSILLFVITFFLNLQNYIAQSITWEKLYNNGAIFRGIETKKSNIICVGITRISNRTKLLLIKVDSKGDTLWSRTFGSSNYDFGASWVIETNDQCYAAAGYGEGPNADAYIFKIDSAGNLLWERNFGGLRLDQALRVFQTSDNGYIIGARSFSFGNGFQEQLYLIKTDSLGNLQWQKVYGDDLSFRDLLQLSEDRGYIFMGSGYLYRINLLGDTLWTKRNVSSCIGKSIREAPNGGFLIGGETNPTNPNKCMIVKTDSMGNLEWEKIYPNVGREIIYDLEVIPKRGYIISGATDFLGNDSFKAMTRIIDFNGNIKYLKYYTPNFYPNSYAEFRSGIPTNDGGFLLSGSIAPISTGIAYIVKTDSLGNITSVASNSSSSSSVPSICLLYQNFPNPFNSTTIIKFDLRKTSIVNISIYNIMGEKIHTLFDSQLTSGSYGLRWAPMNLSSGLYFCKITARSIENTFEFSDTRTMILLK